MNDWYDWCCIVAAGILVVATGCKYSAFTDAYVLAGRVKDALLRIKAMTCAGFVITGLGLLLMFRGYEDGYTTHIDPPDITPDAGFQTNLMKSHMRWFTRAQIIRAMVGMLMVNFIVVPAKDDAIARIEVETDAPVDTAIMLLFVITYLSAHDNVGKKTSNGVRQPTDLFW
jgi:hypothetical protein